MRVDSRSRDLTFHRRRDRLVLLMDVWNEFPPQGPEKVPGTFFSGAVGPTDRRPIGRLNPGR